MSRKLPFAVIVLATIAILVTQLPRHLGPGTSIWPPDDFVEYWCAGRLNLRGENPYSSQRMYELEKEIGWDIGQAVMMWNPPWTLSLVMPLGTLPWREAQVCWFLAKLGVLLWSATAVWQVYGGPERWKWIAWAVALLCLPTLIALRDGQISPFLLLGAVLFLVLERTGYPFWAGVSCVLLATKPHLVYLFWLSAALECVVRKRYAVVLGGICGGLAASAWPFVENPSVFDQYLTAASEHPPAQWMSPTIGTFLRLLFGEEKFWLQYVPMSVGLIWFAFDWLSHYRDWVWSDRMPWLIFVSFVTAPYGAWPYDLVLLLLPVLGLAARYASGSSESRIEVMAAFLAINLGMYGVNLAGVTSVWFFWAAPALLAVASYAERRSTSARVVSQ